jgi:hypothetical protein
MSLSPAVMHPAKKQVRRLFFAYFTQKRIKPQPDRLLHCWGDIH